MFLCVLFQTTIVKKIAIIEWVLPSAIRSAHQVYRRWLSAETGWIERGRTRLRRCLRRTRSQREGLISADNPHQSVECTTHWRNPLLHRYHRGTVAAAAAAATAAAAAAMESWIAEETAVVAVVAAAAAAEAAAMVVAQVADACWWLLGYSPCSLMICLALHSATIR